MKTKQEMETARKLLEAGDGDKIPGLDIRVARGLRGHRQCTPDWEWTGFYQAILWVLDYEGLEGFHSRP